MSSYGGGERPSEVGGLFFDVMSHSNAFGDVTTDAGAAAFNKDFLAKPLPEHAAELDPAFFFSFSRLSNVADSIRLEVPLTIEVIDTVKRKESSFDVFGSKEHIEYIIKLARGSQLKTVGKRYSELTQFHLLLVEHQLVDRIREQTTLFMMPNRRAALPRETDLPRRLVQVSRLYDLILVRFDNTDLSSDFIRARKIA